MVLRQRALRDLASGRFDHWIDPPAPLGAVRIRALVESGEHRRARDELQAVTVAELEGWSPNDLVAAAMAASRVGPLARCHDLLEVVASTDGAVRSDGRGDEVPVAFIEALCLTGLGRYDEAQDRYEEALPTAEKIGPIINAQVRAELGRLHLGLGADRARTARAHLVAAAVCLRASGLAEQADRTTELLECEGPVGCAGPARGLFEPGPRWLVGFGLRAPTTVEDFSGLHALRQLLLDTGRRVPVAQLRRHSEVESQGAELVARSIDRLAEHDEGLAEHLSSSITVGDTVCYQPAAPVRWSLGPPEAVAG